MLKDIIRVGLFVVAGLMLFVGAMLGITWGGTALFDNSIIESGLPTKIGLRVLGVLMCGGAGILNMLVFSNYKRERQEQWKENRG